LVEFNGVVPLSIKRVLLSFFNIHIWWRKAKVSMGSFLSKVFYLFYLVYLGD
jgi:hypothetical protein